ncbi:MAG: RNA polymerase sigma factor [Faecousia sp.]
MSSFSQLYEQYVEQVYRFLLALSGEPSLAEELTQETFYQAFLHIDQFENRCGVSTWLCQIGKNAYFKERKRRKRMVPVEAVGEPLQNSFPDPEEAFLEREQAQRLRIHLSHLPEPYQTVFTLRAYSGTDYKELARLYGKSESWARVTCFRAKEQLLKRLEEEGGR